MEHIILYSIIAVLAAGIIIYICIKFGKVMKMTPEEKKEYLLTFIKGLVAQAESHIGSGHGEQKLKEVETYFQTKAPFAYKLCLKILGKENLKEIIETALDQLKDSFRKS